MYLLICIGGLPVHSCFCAPILIHVGTGVKKKIVSVNAVDMSSETVNVGSVHLCEGIINVVIENFWCVGYSV